MKRPTGMEALRRIDGFGDKKVQRQGREIIELVKASPEETEPNSEPTSDE